MSKRLVFALLLASLAAACAPRQPEPVIGGVQAGVSNEPVFTGKYGN